MDPNETYRRIAAAVAELSVLNDKGLPSTVSRRLDLADEITIGWVDLDEWLSKGGFAPSAWDPTTLGKGRR